MAAAACDDSQDSGFTIWRRGATISSRRATATRTSAPAAKISRKPNLNMHIFLDGVNVAEYAICSDNQIHREKMWRLLIEMCMCRLK